MSKIEWTDRTWNPTTGCNKVSPGCKNCYAETMHRRQQSMNPHKYTKGFSEGVETHEDVLSQPYKWKKPQRIFVNSMSDLFHEDVPFEFIERVFATMRFSSFHTYQILTKRPHRMMEFVKQHYAQFGANNYPHVWLGVSCENQQTADERIPFLLQTPAAVRFLSCEPLLGEINFRWKYVPDNWRANGKCNEYEIFKGTNGNPKIDWIIAGGESGSNSRPMHPDWARSLRDQCQAAGVPFFFKQWGEWIAGDQMHMDFLDFENVQCKTWIEGKKWSYKIGKSKSGHLLDGIEHRVFPSTNHQLTTIN